MFYDELISLNLRGAAGLFPIYSTENFNENSKFMPICGLNIVLSGAKFFRRDCTQHVPAARRGPSATILLCIVHEKMFYFLKTQHNGNSIQIQFKFYEHQDVMSIIQLNSLTTILFARFMSKNLCTDSTLLSAVNFLALSTITLIQLANDTVNVI